MSVITCGDKGANGRNLIRDRIRYRANYDEINWKSKQKKVENGTNTATEATPAPEEKPEAHADSKVGSDKETTS